LENKDCTKKIAVLGIAYHNCGVEEEHLFNYKNALKWHRRAVQFMEKHSSGE
jgi:hypothetical protein